MTERRFHMDVNDAHQRRFKRVPIEIRCGIILRGTFHFADTVSISEGGLLIRAPVPLEIGDNLEIQLTLDSRVICPAGDAIYTLPRSLEYDGYLVGLRFSKIEFD